MPRVTNSQVIEYFTSFTPQDRWDIASIRRQGTAWSNIASENLRTDGISLWLHDTLIACWMGSDLWISLAGHNTLTTRRVLNQLPGVHVTNDRGTIILNDCAWTDRTDSIATWVTPKLRNFEFHGFETPDPLRFLATMLRPTAPTRWSPPGDEDWVAVAEDTLVTCYSRPTERRAPAPARPNYITVSRTPPIGTRKLTALPLP